MATFSYVGQPQPDELVSGLSGHHLIVGTVLPHPRDGRKPFVFSTRGGCVLCYVQDGSGKRWAINEIRKYPGAAAGELG